MSTPQRLTTLEHYQDLLDKFDTWLFDCDGVLWHGNVLVDGALEVLQLLRSRSQSQTTILSLSQAEAYCLPKL